MLFRFQGVRVELNNNDPFGTKYKTPYSNRDYPKHESEVPDISQVLKVSLEVVDLNENFSGSTSSNYYSQRVQG